MSTKASDKQSSRSQWGIALLLLVCVLVVGFWEVLHSRSRRPLRGFALTAADFVDFLPRDPDWEAERLPLNPDPIEPNILAYAVRSKAGRGAPPLRDEAQRPMLVRLVHGYNMPECMRIKDYEVVLSGDTRRAAAGAEPPGSRPGASAGPGPVRVQLWRVTSSSGDVQIWVTGMLRKGDFAETDVDVRSMAFPRVGTPDDPRWVPEGFSLKSLRHPVRNMRRFMRGQWNRSRADLPTFLGLSTPAWASAEVLTLVVATKGPPVGLEEQQSLSGRALSVYGFILRELRAWRQQHPVNER